MKGYHILLGEDEPDILEYNREQLEQRGYQVTAVSTLGQAEACVLRDNPDLLVLDVMMPDGSGLELCRRLREQFQGADSVPHKLGGEQSDCPGAPGRR